MSLKKVLTIAGSDTSGGAGIQADLKTFQERDVYGMTVLTTVVTMDPFNGWSHGVFPIALSTVEEQLKTVLDGIGIDAMKTGMLGSVELIELVAHTIKSKGLQRIVIDPVMVCKGNDEALHPESTVALRELLVPLADVVTPNLFEAAQLADTSPIRTLEDMKEAARIIRETGVSYVLIKGGAKLEHPQAVDLLYDGTTFELFESDKISTGYTHGAGCTYSAAVTAELAKGSEVKEAVRTAKAFISEAIRHGFPINSFVGPTMHSAYRKAQG
ncbi:pyridoxine/pyridoxal/pyridoxamine kinase [Paenibacillus rigui]|uniref:pyridoxal kinase n=1 Tax=Paenibacillus rigui TaxID=554312 RepID=A0A229UQ60_9BACL|nr:pyridoxine/pyridoxal/pyridoxamine kinase [Paenibacillus rigui]OXM85687.1 bifunctional hydroxymethylpyrimidine kinase/phosphomethylpyrimidine kinase [Paenibacillus rigui]